MSSETALELPARHADLRGKLLPGPVDIGGVLLRCADPRTDGDRAAQMLFSAVAPAIGTKARKPLQLAQAKLTGSGADLVVTGDGVTVFSARPLSIEATFAGVSGLLTTLRLNARTSDTTAAPAVLYVAGLQIAFDEVCYRVDHANGCAVTAKLEGHLLDPRLPVSVSIGADGIWVVDVLKVAHDGLVALSIKLGLPDLKETLQTVLSDVGIRISRLEVGVDPRTDKIAYVEVVVDSTIKWTIAKAEAEGKKPALELGLTRVELKTERPGSVGGARFSGTMVGSLTVLQHTFSVSLSNKYGPTNPEGLWLLAPDKPLFFTDVLGFFGLRETVVNALPDWGGKLVEGLRFEQLAIGLDPRSRELSLVRGAIVWEKAAIAGMPTAFELSCVALGVEVRHPRSKAPETSYMCRAEMKYRTFTFALSGRKRGDSWELSASMVGKVDLVGALKDFVDVTYDSNVDLFSKFTLELVNPMVTLDDSGFAVFCGLDINGNKAFQIGEVSAQIDTIWLNAQRTGSGPTAQSRYSFDGRAVEIRFGASLALQRVQVRMAYVTGTGGGLTASISGSVIFPRSESGPEIEIQLAAAYNSGKWKFEGKLGFNSILRLDRVVQTLLGAVGWSLPEGFPSMAATELKVTAESATKAYSATGTIVVEPFTLAGTRIFGLEANQGKPKFTFDVSRTVVGDTAFSKVDVKASVVVDGVEFTLQIVSDTAVTDISATVNKVAVRYVKLTPVSGPKGTVFLVQPTGLVSWIHEPEIALVSLGDPPQPLTLAAEGGRERPPYEAGLNVRARFDLNVLKIPAQVRLGVTAKSLAIDLLDAKGEKMGEMPSTWPARELPPATVVVVPEGEKEEENATEIAGPLSFAPIIKKMGGSGWLETLGNAVVLDHVGVIAHTKPKPAVTLRANITVNFGTWVSVAVQRLAVKLTPDGLAPAQLLKSKAEWSIDGAAIVINVPPWIKGGAAILQDRKESGLTIVGMGELQLMQKIRVGALVYLHWEERKLDKKLEIDAVFGFVFATGFKVPLGPLVLTGIAGGFGYRAVPKLPERPEDVPKNTLLQLLRNSDDSPLTAARMLKQVETFKTAIVRQPDAWCIVFGVTFTLAQMADCAALLVVESRATGMEVALLGVADIKLGGGSSSKGRLAEIQLSLICRWSESAGSIMVLGAITGESWFFDRKCQIKGGFAICTWYKGEHAGDFLISLGGYSPFAPKRAHYPVLDRVGFSWEVSKELSLFGESYFAIDRYSLALGFRAGLKYISETLRAEALVSFDALIEWSPLYYEVHLHLTIRVEVRLAITIRLGLDVDMHCWGPPFGATIDVTVELWPFKASFNIAVGMSREAVQLLRKVPTVNEVLEEARAGRKSWLVPSAGGSPARFVKKNDKLVMFEIERICRSDDLRIRLETGVPAGKVEFAGAKPRVAAARFDLRAARVVGAISTLTVLSDDKRVSASEWSLTAEESFVLDAQWCTPADADKPWDEPRRKLIQALELRANEPTDAGVRHTLEPSRTWAGEAISIVPERVTTLQATNAAALMALFDLAGCDPIKGAA